MLKKSSVRPVDQVCLFKSFWFLTGLILGPESCVVNGNVGPELDEQLISGRGVVRRQILAAVAPNERRIRSSAVSDFHKVITEMRRTLRMLVLLL